MRMGSSLVKDERGMGVENAVPVVTEPVTTSDRSVLNCIASKARYHAWNLGDQAMRKTTLEMTRGCP